MIKSVSILILAIGMSSCNTINPFEFEEFELEKELYGNWEYQKLLIDGEWVAASEQNECGYKDVLEISSTYHVEIEYDFNGVNIKGHKAGISMAKVCNFDPFTFKPSVSGNVCTLSWVTPVYNRNQIILMTDALVIEYKLELINRNLMMLSKVREIENYGFKQPDKIELKRIKEG